VFPTDPSLATPSSSSQHHDISRALPAASSLTQPLPIRAGVSLQTLGISPPNLSHSPRDPRFSSRTPEQEISFGQNPEEANSDSTKNPCTSLNRHDSVQRRLGYQRDTFSSQTYQFPNSRHEGPEQHVQLTSVSTSPASSSSTQPSPEPGTLVQISPQQIPSRGRRKNDRQFKCSTCPKVFLRRCDLK
jgi:hypothetical protein